MVGFKNNMKRISERIHEKLLEGIIFLIVLSFFLIFKPPCFFQAVFGIPCAGCGITRAYYCLFHLDLKGALEMHPMFWSVPIFVLYYLFDFEPFKNKLVNYGLISVLGVGFLACWIAKLV